MRMEMSRASQKRLHETILRLSMENLEGTIWWTTDDETLEGIKQMIRDSPILKQDTILVIEAVQRKRSAA